MLSTQHPQCAPEQKDPQVSRLLTVVIREGTQRSLKLVGFLCTVESIDGASIFKMCKHHSLCFTQQRPNRFNAAAIYGALKPQRQS